MDDPAWRDPSDWSGQPFPNKFGTQRVRLLVDYGCGDVEVAGRAWGIKHPIDGPTVVYSDIGGWCTQYVKGWKPTALERDEIDDDQDRDD